jgi:tetratricopeptide (TPR) repeat protein
MLVDCAKCGEPLFDHMAACTRCEAPNPAHDAGAAAPGLASPWPLRMSYVVGVTGLTRAAIQGLGILFAVSGTRGTTPGQVADFALDLAVGLAAILVPLNTDVLDSEPRGPARSGVIYAALMVAMALLFLPIGEWWDDRGFRRAVQLEQAARYEEAEAAYRDVLARDARMPEARFNLASLYARKKEWARAEAEYLKVIELRPEAREPYAALAWVYEQSQRREKAIELLKVAAARNDRDAVFWLALGVSYLDAGRTAEAEAALRKTLALDPGRVEAYFYLGSVYIGQNRTAEAIGHLEKYVSLSPMDPDKVAAARGLLQALKRGK